MSGAENFSPRPQGDPFLNASESYQRARALGATGQKAVAEGFNVATMTRSLLTHFEGIAKREAHAAQAG